jgi:hypothetical protein
MKSGHGELLSQIEIGWLRRMNIAVEGSSNWEEHEGKTPRYGLTGCAPFENRERCGSLKLWRSQHKSKVRQPPYRCPSFRTRLFCFFFDWIKAMNIRTPIAFSKNLATWNAALCVEYCRWSVRKA